MRQEHRLPGLFRPIELAIGGIAFKPNGAFDGSHAYLSSDKNLKG